MIYRNIILILGIVILSSLIASCSGKTSAQDISSTQSQSLALPSERAAVMPVPAVLPAVPSEPEPSAVVVAELESTDDVQPVPLPATEPTEVPHLVPPSEVEPPSSVPEVAGHPAISDDFSPLPEDIRGELAALPWDITPEVLNAVYKKNEGGHFPWSDELHPELFYEHIRDLGGTYIGIGTDQAYVYIGWQKPTLAFAVDYDPWAVNIHLGYRAIFSACEDYSCFREKVEDKKGIHSFLLNYYEANADRKNIAKIFRSVQGGLGRQLRRIERYPYPTFANDAETYKFIRAMVMSGRIITLQSNLLGDVSIQAISEILKKYGRTVTTFYTSNAEQYWGYSRQFRQNMRSIPWGEKSYIMRTQATKPKNGDYIYRMMPSDVFLEWLEHPDGKNVQRICTKYRFEHALDDPEEKQTGDPPDIPFVMDDVRPSQTAK